MDLYTGLLNLTNWVGNVIMPTIAGLFFSMAVVCFAKGRDYHHWMYGGLLSLMASGLLRAMETFSSQLAWNNPDLYWNSLLNLVNWVGNVDLAALWNAANRHWSRPLRRNPGASHDRSKLPP